MTGRSAQENDPVSQFYNWEIVFEPECEIGIRNELAGLVARGRVQSDVSSHFMRPFCF